jgi:hypothetical protein
MSLQVPEADDLEITGWRDMINHITADLEKCDDQARRTRRSVRTQDRLGRTVKRRRKVVTRGVLSQLFERIS